MITTERAAKILGMSCGTVTELVAKGAIKAQRLAWTWAVEESDVHEFARRNGLEIKEAASATSGD